MDQKILWKLSYGVYAVCSLDGSRPTGCIANSAMQITSAPPSIAISINHDNYTHGCIEKTGRFSPVCSPKDLLSLSHWPAGLFQRPGYG